jgi:hypothetical protein
MEIKWIRIKKRIHTINALKKLDKKAEKKGYRFIMGNFWK